jgi:diaminopimelate decarboxylase
MPINPSLPFPTLEKRMFCEEVELAKLASRFGTPLYVYSANTLRSRFRAFNDAFRHVPHLVCYSVKANPNLSVLELLAKEGAGFDVVSGGELLRVAKAAPKSLRKVVFSGVGKTREELELALAKKVMLFNVESEQELEQLARLAERKRTTANIALRVNPDVSAETHPYISTGLHEHKFGVPIGDAIRLYKAASVSKRLTPMGISVHIGSQITGLDAFADAMKRVADLAVRLRSSGISVQYIDAGGGLGIDYHRDENIAEFEARCAEYATAITGALRGLDVTLVLEPGRSVVARAGALLTKVIYTKKNGKKNFLVVDAAMNDLIRPSLYNAYHRIVPVKQDGLETLKFEVVGPVCESGDFLGHDRELPEARPGDLLAVMDAGAYGMSLASNYNTRPRAAEVLVEGKRARPIRKRETLNDLLRAER